MTDIKISKNYFEKILSAAEVAEKRISITKQALKFFPKPWKDFWLDFEGTKIALHIESVACQCMGPQKPHEHYWIQDTKIKQLLPWKTGIKLIFEKINEKNFTLRIGK